jgi:hypothetical protein
MNAIDNLKNDKGRVNVEGKKGVKEIHTNLPEQQEAKQCMSKEFLRVVNLNHNQKINLGGNILRQ